MKIKYWGEEYWDKNKFGVIMCPGFLGYKEEKMWVDLGEKLEKLKIGSVAWDPSGYGAEAEEFKSKYKPTNWIVDLNKLMADLENKGIKKERVILVGNSMGGLVSAFFAAENKVGGLVLISSPYQVGTEDDLTKELEEWENSGEKVFISSKWGEIRVPFGFVLDAKKYNVLNVCDKINCPKLVIAGDKDKTVSYGATRKIFDKCREPKEWHLINGMEHKYKNNPQILEEVNGIVVDFVRKLL